MPGSASQSVNRLASISGFRYPKTLTRSASFGKAAASGIFMAAAGVFAADPDRRPAATRVNVAYARDAKFLTFLRRHVFVR